MKATAFKEVPLKDYQVLLDDPDFQNLIRCHYAKWQTYKLGDSIWLCTEFHELIHLGELAKLQDYCSRRSLNMAVQVHPCKPDYLLVMIQKPSQGRLTKKKIAPKKTAEGSAKRIYSALQKAIVRNGDMLTNSGSVAYEAERLSNALNY